MRVQTDSPSAVRWLAVAVLVFAAAAMIVFRASEQTGDSLEYARSARTGTSLFHPHHLIFNPLVRLCWLGLRAVFPSVDPIAAGQVHNIFWALILLAAVFVLVRRMTGSGLAAAVYTAAFFSTIGVWRYATLVEVYVPSMACASVALVLLYRRPERRSFRLQAAAVVFAALAILYDQMAVFFVVALAVLWTPRFGSRGIRRTAGRIAAAGGIVLGAYVTAFLATSGPPTPSGFLRWCLSYAYNPDPSWGTLSNVSLAGMAKEFLSFAQSVIVVPRTILIPVAALSGLLCGLLAFLIIRSIVRRRTDASFRTALFSWLFAAALFMLWFSPGGEELAIPFLLPAFLLIVRLLADDWESSPGVDRLRRRILTVSAAAGATILIVNFIGAVLPAHVSRGTAYEEAALLEKQAPAGAAIFTSYETAESLMYYFDRSPAVNLSPVLFSFYGSRPLEPGMIPDDQQPIFVSVESLRPGKSLAGLFDGDIRPGRWLAFIEWICGCEIRAGRIVAARVPAAAFGVPGYLILSGERSPMDGPGDLFRRLDEAAAAASSEYAGAFSAWLERHPEEGR